MCKGAQGIARCFGAHGLSIVTNEHSSQIAASAPPLLALAAATAALKFPVIAGWQESLCGVKGGAIMWR
jgi:hypothetical protein